MSHTIFAGIPTAGLPWIIDALTQTGYQASEISIVTTTDQPLPASLQLAWQIGRHNLFSQGPLTEHFTQRFAATLPAALRDYGLPAYAVRHCEALLDRDDALIAVHTNNAFEIEPLADLLHDHGCLYMATVGRVPDLQVA